MEENRSAEENETAATEESGPMLTALEARVLGSLMEKQLTTPDAYPLTLNSLVTACNQKTSREPVMKLENGEVQHCLNKLRDRSLVEVEYGSRADRYRQRLSRTLHQSKAEHAIFAVMILRGPQTVSELYTRTQRMFEFEGLNDVEDLLDKLLGRLKPLIQKMPRQPGMREDRYMHLLCGEPEPMAHQPPSRTVESRDELEERVEVLERQVAVLLKELGLEQD